MDDLQEEDFIIPEEEETLCDHICTGNCRREGCNCDCGGEWHDITD